MLSHSTTRFFFGPCRRLAPFLVLLILPLLAFCATQRENLPQSKDQVVLPEPSRQALMKTLESGSYTLDRASSASFMAGLPESFRDACGDVFQNFGDQARQSAQWSVRVLLALHTPQGSQALLALRCGLNTPGEEPPYDERPALVTFAGPSTTLRFIPVEEECDHCPDQFYHVQSSKIAPVKGALLIELRVSDSNNPCCDGPESSSKDRLILLALPEGQQVLALEEMSEESSEDDSDENGGSYLACHSKIDYSSDIAGNADTIQIQTSCLKDNNKVPEVKDRTFRWNANARRFDEQQPALSKAIGK